MITPVKNLETAFKLIKCERARERMTERDRGREREVFHALIRVTSEETVRRYGCRGING